MVVNSRDQPKNCLHFVNFTLKKPFNEFYPKTTLNESYNDVAPW